MSLSDYIQHTDWEGWRCGHCLGVADIQDADSVICLDCKKTVQGDRILDIVETPYGCLLVTNGSKL